MNEKTLTQDFFNEFFPESREQSPNKHLYDWLNADNLGNIVLDGSIFWIELTSSNATMPQYVYNFIIKWCKKKGYTYLYKI